MPVEISSLRFGNALISDFGKGVRSRIPITTSNSFNALATSSSLSICELNTLIATFGPKLFQSAESKAVFW